MPQSLAPVYLHLVFSTKERKAWLRDHAIREEAHCFLGGICNRLNCPVSRIGGVEDHVHILCRLGRTVSIAHLIKELKRESTKWIKTKGQALHDFHWQNGYGAFSVSPAHTDALLTYIAGQEEHHKRESFQDEFRRLLSKYGMQWDERYVWD